MSCGLPVCSAVLLAVAGETVVIPLQVPAAATVDLGRMWTGGRVLLEVDEGSVRSVAADWRVSTNFGISLEGPHVELESGPFAWTQWVPLVSERPGLWRFPDPPAELPRPPLGRDALIEAFRKHTGGDPRWVDAATVCAPDCPFGVATWELRIRATSYTDVVTEQILVVKAVRGC